MTLPAQPQLEPGHAYRTRDLRAWGKNPARLAQRLVHEGKLREAAHGLYYAPLSTWFGSAPASDEALLAGFLGTNSFLLTGPARWNALGLGTTAMFAATLVYNTQRTGEFTLDGRKFMLRRVLFPDRPQPEWFIVDLFQHHDMAAIELHELETSLLAQLRLGRWNREELRELAAEYGSKATVAAVGRCLRAAAA